MKKYKTAEILGIRVERISLPGGRTQPKLIVKVRTKNNQEFEISEIFFSKDGNETCQGLWVNLNAQGDIAARSTLKHMMTYFGIQELDELTGKVAKIRHNSEGYYAINCID